MHPAGHGAQSSRGAEKLRAAHLEASAGGARLGGALLLVGGSTLASFTALAALAAFLLATRYHQPHLAPVARRSHRVLQAQAPQRMKHATPPPARARAMTSRVHSIPWLLAATSRSGSAQERGIRTSPAIVVRLLASTLPKLGAHLCFSNSIPLPLLFLFLCNHLNFFLKKKKRNAPPTACPTCHALCGFHRETAQMLTRDSDFMSGIHEHRNSTPLASANTPPPHGPSCVHTVYG